MFLFRAHPPEVTSAQNGDKSCVQELEEKFTAAMFQLTSFGTKTKHLYF
jgi:hypothetical protein